MDGLDEGRNMIHDALPATDDERRIGRAIAVVLIALTCAVGGLVLWGVWALVSGLLNWV